MVNAQVKVLGKIEPNGSTDTYPTHTDTLGRGGLMAVGTWQERNAIPRPRRKAGMLVRVKSATVDSTYTIGGNLTNADWIPFVVGGGIPTNLVTTDTEQTITGKKIFDQFITVKNGITGVNVQGDQYSLTPAMLLMGVGGKTAMLEPNAFATTSRMYRLPLENGTLATTADIPAPVDINGKANIAGGNTFTGQQKIDAPLTLTNPNEDEDFRPYINFKLKDIDNGTFYTHKLVGGTTYANAIIELPSNSGRIPLASELNTKASLVGGNNFTGGIQVINHGIESSGDASNLVSQGLTVKSSYLSGGELDWISNAVVNGGGLYFSDEGNIISPVTIYGRYAISFNRGGYNTHITPNVLNTEHTNVVLPNKSGTLTVNSDIPKMLSFESYEINNVHEFDISSLGFTPTFMVATINSSPYGINLVDDVAINTVYVSGTDLVIKTTTNVPVGTKFSVMLK